MEILNGERVSIPKALLTGCKGTVVSRCDRALAYGVMGQCSICGEDLRFGILNPCALKAAEAGRLAPDPWTREWRELR
jgi:hypothetical protein